MNRKQRSAGFTLIEISITIAILGILLAVAITSGSTARNEAKLEACKETLETIRTAEATFFLSNRTYGTIDQLVTGGYIKEVPKCPASGTPYTFESATEEGSDRIINFTCTCTGSHTLPDGGSDCHPRYSVHNGIEENPDN